MSVYSFCRTGFLLAALWLLRAAYALPVSAQAVDTFRYRSAASIRNLSGALFPNSGQLMLVEAQFAPHQDSTLLQQVWLDKHLRPRQRAVVRVRGKKLHPEQVQAFGHRVVVQLASRDTLHLLALDTTGRLVAQVREPQPTPRQYRQLLLDLPQLPGALSLRKWQGRGRSELTYRDENLRPRWTQELPESVRLNVAADSAYLWVLLTDYHGYRHPITTLVCLDLAAGTELSRTQLAPTPEHNQLVPSVMRPGPGHSLFIVGHAYRGRAVNTHHPGDLFLLRMSPSGQALATMKVPFRRVPQQQGARARRLAWVGVQPDAQGGARLIGETYTTTPAAASFIRTSFSLGLLGYTVLRPKDVVSLYLTPAGQAEQVRVVPLLADRGSFVWPAMASPLGLEQLAAEANGFRSRGLAADSVTLVLRSPQQVQALNLRTGQPTLQVPAPARGQADVLYVGSDFLILAEVRSLRLGMLLTRLRLPGAR